MSKKHTILIIDDDKNIIDSLSSLYRDQGYQPVGAQTGHIAMELVSDNSFDLIILDLGLPDVDGIDLLKSIKDAKISAPVIIVSGQATIQKAIEATRLGAFNVIEKPPDPQKLLLDSEIAIKHKSLESEVGRLRRSLALQNDIIGESASAMAMREKLRRVSGTDSRVYIYGEPGAGKEMAARFIHFSSNRASGPFIAINCAAIPENLFESELFGHEKGSFTGAVASRKGKFELADSGSIFLDEVGELRPDHQAKLLRAIETSTIERVGGSKEIRVDVRVISASNKDLQKETHDGRFREDLYFRLNVIPVFVPPLRNRKEDIPLLARFFLDNLGYGHLKLDSAAISSLTAYDWPGNIRELKNIIERSAALCYGDIVSDVDIRESLAGMQGDDAKKLGPAGKQLSLREYLLRFEKSLLEDILRETDGNITRASKLLKIDRGNLSKKLKKFGLTGQE